VLRCATHSRPGSGGAMAHGGAGTSDQQRIIATVSRNTIQHFRMKQSAGMVTVVLAGTLITGRL